MQKYFVHVTNIFIILIILTWRCELFTKSFVFRIYMFFTKSIDFCLKLVIWGSVFLISFILALKVVIVVRLVVWSILSSLSLILALYLVFLTTWFFTRSLNRKEQVLIYQNLIDRLYFSNCLNYLVHFSIYQYLIYLHQILN